MQVLDDAEQTPCVREPTQDGPNRAQPTGQSKLAKEGKALPLAGENPHRRGRDSYVVRSRGKRRRFSKRCRVFESTKGLGSKTGGPGKVSLSASMVFAATTSPLLNDRQLCRGGAPKRQKKD